MGNRYRHTYMSSLHCGVCYFINPIIRPQGKRRARGHVKTMWCPRCRDIRDFVENGETE